MRAYITPLEIKNNYYKLAIYIAKRPNKHVRYLFTIAGLDGLKAEIEAEEAAIRANPDADIDRQVYLSEIRNRLKNVPRVVQNKGNEFGIYLDNITITKHDVDYVVKYYLQVTSIKWKRSK
jgi:hypothetical protein